MRHEPRFRPVPVLRRALLVSAALAPLLAPTFARAAKGYLRHPDLHEDTVIFTAEGDLWTAPVTGGTARRVIHAAPVVFKGSGFYVTDNRKSAPEAESEAKAESKPEPTRVDEDSAARDAEPAAAS